MKEKNNLHIKVDEEKNSNLKNTLIKDEEIDVLKLFFILKSELKTLAIITSMFLLAGIIYALFATPWYKADVKILPTVGQGNNILGQYSGLASMAGISLGKYENNNYYSNLQ